MCVCVRVCVRACVVMRTSQKKCCLDMRVMCGANYWSDHYMMRAKLRMMFFLPVKLRSASCHLVRTGLLGLSCGSVMYDF